MSHVNNISEVSIASSNEVNVPENSHSQDYNHDKCLARLASNIHKQCGNNPKNNGIFCGVHLKSNNVKRIDIPLNSHSTKTINKTSSKSNIKITRKKIKKGNVLTLNDLSIVEFNISNIRSRDLFATIDFYKLEKPINKTGCFDLVLSQLRTLETYKSYQHEIIKLQSLIRGYCIRELNRLRGPALFKRSLVNNETDFLTFEPVNAIPINKFFSYEDKDGFIYGFNIQSIKYLIDNSESNPYNRNKFSTKCETNFNKLVKIEENKGNNLDVVFEESKDPHIKMKQRCVKIFQRMDELELYTQPRWFLDLPISKLRTLYAEIEDIWNYRAMLSSSMKKLYTKDGKAFIKTVSSINKVDNKTKLQNILLEEFEKFAFEGKTKEDCVTSCYWILTGLTMVSVDAAEGMSELVQSQIIN